MLRTALDFVASEVKDATTYAVTSFYQGARNFANDVGDYYSGQYNNFTQQTNATERKARNEQRRTELNKLKAKYNKANASELANFKTEITDLMRQTEAELKALETPYFSAFSRSGAINLKKQEKKILQKLIEAESFASLKLLAEEQAEFVIKNSLLDLLLDRIKQVSSEVICNQRVAM